MSEPMAVVKMPTLLDLSKVRAFSDEQKSRVAAVPTVLANDTGDSMPFRRRYSDLEAMARAKRAKVAAGAWMNDAHERLQRHRKSLDGMERSQLGLPVPRGVTNTVQVPRILFKSPTTQQLVDSKKYSDMVERFQIRRIGPVSSYQTTHSMTTSRSVSSTARSVKVLPITTSEAEGSDLHGHSRLYRSRHSISSVGRRSSVGPPSVLIPEEDSPRDLADATVDEAPSISWREWFQRWTYEVCSPLSPVSRTSQVRAVLLVIAFAFHIIFFPVETAFFPDEDHSDFTKTLERAFEFILILDCLVTFNTSYFNKRGALVTSRKAIARRYARGWLVLDMLSAIPIEWLLVTVVTTGPDTIWIHALVDGLLRVPRFVHITQIARKAWQPRLHESDSSIFTLIFYSRYSHLVSIANVILYIVMGAHYMACILKLLSDQSTTIQEDPIGQYVSKFYDALQLLQGQGVRTTTVSESLFAATSILVGSIVLAIVFGHVAILVSNFNANSTNYQRKMESVFAIMSKLQLPAPLRERIHQYYEHLWREYESLDGEIVSFSKGLSHTLELEVVLFKYMDLIMHVPFWRDGSPDFQKQLMLHLSVRVYLPDDFIIRRGEVGDEFFMINRGVCELVLGPDSCEFPTDGLEGETGHEANGERLNPASSTSARRECFDKQRVPLSGRPRGRGGAAASESSSRRVKVMGRGQAVGEMALLMNYERTADLRALTYVEMCVLSRSDIQKIFLKHPNDRKYVIQSMLTRVLETKEANKADCSLKNLVSSVFGAIDDANNGGGINHKPAGISATHAALLVAAVVDVSPGDKSIKFGIDDSLKKKIADLKNKGLPVEDSPPDEACEIGRQHEGVRDENAEHAHLMSSRLENLHKSQQRLLEAMEDLRRDLKAVRESQSFLLPP